MSKEILNRKQRQMMASKKFNRVNKNIKEAWSIFNNKKVK